jgi:IclR family transcriptional regulator, pca regulon regulatory protein
LRLIRTLEEAGYIRQDAATKRYRLSWKMLQLQDVTVSVLDYADLARSHLEALSAEIHETTGMAVLDGLEVRHAIRIASNRIISPNIPPGALFPAHATAMGKVLLADREEAMVRQVAERHPFVRFTDRTVVDVDEFLAQLPEVARQGYAVSDGEWERVIRSIAAPVRTRDGVVVAAVCAVTVSPDMTVADMQRDYLPAVIRSANAISQALGYC